MILKWPNICGHLQPCKTTINFRVIPARSKKNIRWFVYKFHVMSRFFYLVFFLLSPYFDCSTLPWWWVVLQPNTAHGHSIGIGSEPVNAPEMGTFFHIDWENGSRHFGGSQQSCRRWVQASERYRRRSHYLPKWTERLWMKHMARNWQKSNWKKKLPVGGRWVGSVRPPETQVFFSGLTWKKKGMGGSFSSKIWHVYTYGIKMINN